MNANDNDMKQAGHTARDAVDQMGAKLQNGGKAGLQAAEDMADTETWARRSATRRQS